MPYCSIMKQLLSDANIRLDYISRINYATTQNGFKYLSICEITNDDDCDWHDIRVKISGELLNASESLLSLIPKGKTVTVSGIDIKPDIDRLRQLTESTDTQFEFTVSISGKEVFSQTHAIRLMSFDYWPGTGTMPEIISSFVTPNTTSLGEVKIEAAKQLERLTGSSSLDSYQTMDPTRIRAMVASVYEALRAQSIVYVASPPSFEKQGQRVRMVDEVITQKQATCLDLTLLMASVLEAIGLNPIVIISKGHAYLGCWLVDKYYPQTICDDVSFLSKSIADGISEIVVVETTCITSNGVSFEEAVKVAEDHIHLEADDFEMAVDINRCRQLGIRPLPVMSAETSSLEGVHHDTATDMVNEMHQYDIPTDENRHLTRQQIWERKLLDFSLRNNLLNMRQGKKLLPFVSFDIDMLEDHVQAREDFKIMPCPIDIDQPRGEGLMPDSRNYREQLELLVKEGLKHDQLYTYLNEADLGVSLKNLFRASRTAKEENGANTLFLVLGMMKWYETEKSVKPRYAPLILEPVDLVKKSGNSYIMRLREEDITFNTTLVEMMSQQYDIHLTGLTPLPTDDSGIDIKQVFSIVRAIIKDKARWDVVEESMLGLFSFNKFVMWNDIHNNADKMRANPVVASLIEKRLVDIKGGSGTDTRQVDSTVAPGNYAIPVDVDSSQLEAVIESGEGHSFILYGPPGTGKSQTITNMIANALYHDRRVLFVAEKMAALEVVQKRLAKIGLDPFCLEMHSNKMTKSHLLQQLQSALDLTRIKSPEEYSRESEALFEQRKALIKQVELLHEKQGTGLSLYDYIIRYTEAASDEEIPQSPAFIDGITTDRIAEAEKTIGEMDAVTGITGAPNAHPLYGLCITDPSYDAQQKASAIIQQAAQQAPNARNAIHSISSINGITLPDTPEGAQWVERFVDAINSTPVVNAEIMRITDDATLLKQWEEHIGNGMTMANLTSSITKDYSQEVLSLNVVNLRAEWANACAKWFIPRYFAKKNVVKSLRGYRAAMSADDVEPLIDSLQQYNDVSGMLSPLRQYSSRIFGAIGTPGKEDWQKMAESLSKAPALRELVKQTGVPAAYIPSLNGDATKSVDINAVRQLNALLSSSSQWLTIDQGITLDDITGRSAQWLMNIGKSRDWAQWCLRRQHLRSSNLSAVASYIEQGHTSHETLQAMRRGLYKKLAMDVIDNKAELQMFNGVIFEEAISRYRSMAKQFQELTKKALYCKLASRIPSLTIEAASSSEIGILKRHIQSGGRGTTIRHIIDQIPTLLPKLCPCMLMSPISVAQFIDLDQEKFDIVVFDEASQMPTSEAVGAIARGKALIVVGDPKQMPPTSFFTTTTVDESEADNDDMESILDDCITLSFPDHYLTWHYRSRHESLIAFSNSQYYDGKLYTFPSVDDRASKVSLVPIDGTYDMGKSRCNRAEAEAIVKEVVRRLGDPELQKLSIGIVSFSKVQQDLIEDILVEELSKSPQLEKIAYDAEEPIFVKNLENVQGDERDVILFSVGYGPDKNGKVSMNFGPLNNSGGERRLNVAVSRARYEMKVFSTLQPEQIDLNRSRARGVEGLKRFLEFAKNGRMPVAANQVLNDNETALVDSIADELRLHGYEVDTQVGRSRFKVDAAVIDPSNPNNYLMGIIVDGSDYYYTKTERDREICQPGVLQGLGWNIMRVWAIDWFMNRQTVTDRIVDKLEQLANPSNAKPEKATSSPATTPAQQSPQVEAQSQKIAAIPFAVNSDEIVTDIANNKEADYPSERIAKRYTNLPQEALPMMRRNILSDISKTILIEQPITMSLLRQRILDIYGQSRMTQRLQYLLEKGVEKSYIDPQSVPDNPTFWENAEAAKGYDKYRKSSGRKIEDMPLVEVRNVIEMAIRQQLSISEEDLYRQIVKLLGYGRRTAKTDDVMALALGRLVSDSIVERNDGIVILANHQ